MNTLITKYTIYPEDIDDGIECDAEIVFDPEGYIESFDLTAADNSNLVDYQIYCSHVIEWKEDFDAGALSKHHQASIPQMALAAKPATDPKSSV